MSTYPEDPDGFILYDERPDPLDNRRVNRTRFAAVNLPILLGIGVVSALLLWINNHAWNNAASADRSEAPCTSLLSPFTA